MRMSEAVLEERACDAMKVLENHGAPEPHGPPHTREHDATHPQHQEHSRIESVKEQSCSDIANQTRPSSTAGQPMRRSKSDGRVKLVRSLAVCEDTSPVTVTEPSHQDKIHYQTVEKEESANGDEEPSERSLEATERTDKVPRRSLSRDPSQEYTDSTGIDLHEFLVNTLKNNPRDRMMLLKLEQDILDFISSNECHKRKFPPMTSYHRMLLHRVAAYFGLEHNVDPTGKSVIINKTSNTRIPDQKFSEHIKDDRTDDFQKRYILKRDSLSLDQEDGRLRMRLKDDRRSKSIEERKEEYQKARDRIFAQNGQDHFQFDKRIHEHVSYISSHQRRQMFRLRDSSSENEPRGLDPRPWSSTDSDSSHRNGRPAITKASSFSGISLLIRRDSTASSKSTGRLSKTGSESSNSVGSSTGSLSQPGRVRAHGADPSPPRSAAIESASAATNGHAITNTSYYLLPAEASGVPASGVLQNPQTGQPFGTSDVRAAVYNPAMTSQQGRVQQHMAQAPHAHAHAHPTQHQPANHVLTQRCGQCVQYSAISYPPPPPPPPLLPASLNQQYSGDGLNSQFSQLTLTPGEVPDSQTGVYTYPMVLQNPVSTGYVLQPGQPVPVPTYPPPTPGIQQQGYIQQPVQQMSACYCAPAQYSHSNQHYRPVTPVQYNAPQSQTVPPQQPGYQTIMPGQAHNYQSMMGTQQPQSQSLVGSQAGMANQIQGVVVQYPPVPTYQGTQNVSQPAYQQQLVLQAPTNQTPVPSASMQVYYSVLPPAQHSTVSSAVGFLPPPGSEQMQFPRTASPCGSQPIPTQQCTGVPSVPPGGGSVLMMQLSVPPPPPTQWKHNKYYSLDQQHHPHGSKMAELCMLDTTQNSPQLTSSSPSPAHSPGPAHLANLKGVCAGLTPLPMMPQFPLPFLPGQGDARYPLIGQPLQYNPPIRPPLLHGSLINHHYLHHQGPVGIRHGGHGGHGGRGRRLARKSLSTDTSTGETATGRVLEVTDLPAGISRAEADSLLAELGKAGAHIRWLPDDGSTGSDSSTVPPRDRASAYTVLATFPSKQAAQSALLKLNNTPEGTFRLKTIQRADSQ